MLSAPHAFAGLARVLRDRRGFAAGEFALVIPAMLTLTLGAFEVGKYYQAANQVVQVTSMIGQMTSQLPGSAARKDVQNIWRAAPLIAPESFRMAKQLGRSDWSQTLGVTITSVSFAKKDAGCAADCAMEAKVAWSVGTDPMRCGTLRQVPDGTANARGTVPKLLVTEGTAIFVEASLSYATIFGSSFVPPTTITESVWMRPRNVAQIKLSGSGLPAPAAASCPGVA